MKLMKGKNVRNEVFSGKVEVKRGFENIIIPLGDSNRLYLTNKEALELAMLLSVALNAEMNENGWIKDAN